MLRVLIPILITPYFAFAETASSWSEAKKWMRDIIYKDHAITFYCGCNYEATETASGGRIDLDSCNYDSSRSSHQRRAERLEWEHVVPASLTPARQMLCWIDNGRRYCEQHSPAAKKIIFDLHNLTPSIGQVNALRNNSRYGMLDGEDRNLGACDFEWNSAFSEPKPNIRGDVARIWLYMNDQHGVSMSSNEIEMFRQWSNDDPPDEWEFERNERIKLKQGNGNRFVESFRVP